MLHPRIASSRLHALARQFPAVSIVGPRQSGKSTLARISFPDDEMFDLEDPVVLDRVGADPLLLLEEHRHIVFDEVQRLPTLFPVLRSFLDAHPGRRVVLLGSASPSLMKGISESLTGRVGFLDLASMSVFEHEPNALWLKGAFPRVHWSRPRAKPQEWFPAYLRTSLEQDIPQLGFSISSARLRALLMMVAHGQGGLLNLSELGAALGISYHSVAHLIDVLEGVFLLRRLPPFFANIKKRLVKSPKLYVRDTGVLHSLLGMPFARGPLLRHPRVGASFETFCIEQIIQHARLYDPSSEAFFFRTHTGIEVDLILSLRGKLVPIEVKLGLGAPDVRGLEQGMSELGLERGYVVYAGAGRTQVRRGIWLCGLRELLRELDLAPPEWPPSAPHDPSRKRRQRPRTTRRTKR
jgi:predicted AAA+ superfamily ATPase